MPVKFYPKDNTHIHNIETSLPFKITKCLSRHIHREQGTANDHCVSWKFCLIHKKPQTTKPPHIESTFTGLTTLAGWLRLEVPVAVVVLHKVCL
jgi:hypothetical protein